jgi:polyisoprenoid-binding protein YceI
MKPRIVKIISLFAIGLFGTAFTVSDPEIFVTRTGHVRFFSHTSIEDIEANSHQVSSSINTATGELAFVLLMKSFEFEKAKMQEDFNTDYLETDEFPKSSFKGRITDVSAINFSQAGTYNADVTGDLRIHGVTRSITAKATLTVGNDQIIGTSKIQVRLADYNVSGPSIAGGSIAEVIEVDIHMVYKPKES